MARSDVDDWALEAPPELLIGVALANRLWDADAALDDGPDLFIDHAAIAGLTAHEATLIVLPPLTDAIAAVSTRGLINRPGLHCRFGVETPHRSANRRCRALWCLASDR